MTFKPINAANHSEPLIKVHITDYVDDSQRSLRVEDGRERGANRKYFLRK
jgi:hypothetical protein